MAEDAGSGTATLEVPAQTHANAGPPASTSASDEDAGTGMVKVPDAPEKPAPPSNRLPGESDAAFKRRMYDVATGKAELKPPPTEARTPDGKFAPKPEGAEGQALEDAKAAKAAEEAKQAEAKGEEKADDPLATRDQREMYVKATRALARDGYTTEEMDAMGIARVLELGTRRAELQAKVDDELARARGNQPRPGDPAQTKAEQEAEAAELAETKANLGIPADVLEFLPPDDQEALKGHVAKYVQQQTKAAEYTAYKAQANLAEFMGAAIVRDLAADYPALKGKEKNPPPDFLAEFYAQREHHDWLTEGGMRKAMEAAALITYGKQAKQQIQQQMLDSNRAALKNQPDPKTLTAATKPQALTKKQHSRLAYEALSHGRTLAEQSAWLEKQVAGRPIVG